MLKITKSLLMIAIVCFIAVGTTKSYFTDTETVSDNNVTLGTLNMTIGDETFVPISITNLKPGDIIEKSITINNEGSLDFGSLKVSLVGTNDPSSLLEQLTINTSVLIAESAGPFIPNKGSRISDQELLGENITIAPGQPAAVVLSIEIPAELGNEFQSVGASFDLVFNAEQVK